MNFLEKSHLTWLLFLKIISKNSNSTWLQTVYVLCPNSWDKYFMSSSQRNWIILFCK